MHGSFAQREFSYFNEQAIKRACARIAACDHPSAAKQLLSLGNNNSLRIVEVWLVKRLGVEWKWDFVMRKRKWEGQSIPGNVWERFSVWESERDGERVRREGVRPVIPTAMSGELNYFFRKFARGICFLDRRAVIQNAEATPVKAGQGACYIRDRRKFFINYLIR